MTMANATPTIDELLRVQREFAARHAEIDRGMVAALIRFVAESGWSVSGLADMLGVSFGEMLGVLDGKVPISGYLWDQFRRVFEPLRPKEGNHHARPGQ